MEGYEDYLYMCFMSMCTCECMWVYLHRGHTKSGLQKAVSLPPVRRLIGRVTLLAIRLKSRK